MAQTANLIKPAKDVMESRTEANKYTQLSFPSNLGTYAIVFNFSEYKFNNTAGQVNQILETSIALPIPTNIIDTFNMRVAGAELGSIGGAVKDIASDVGTGNATVTGVVESVAGATTAVGLKKGAAAIDSLTGTNIQKAADIAGGYTTNPRLALAFEGVDLKVHNFSWTLAPRSERESDTIKDIIRIIKKNSLPTYTLGTKAFLNYPSVVDIFFLGTAEDHMYYFKRCMVNQVSINYAGGGSVAFLEGGKPAVIQLQINFTEIDIHTAEDYGAPLSSLKNAVHALGGN